MGRACLSVRAFDCVGMENSLDGTDSGRARVGRSTARPSSARVRLLVDLARVGRATARPSVCARCGTVDCASVVRARSTACQSGAHETVDCLSVRLRACDRDCASRGHGKHGHEKGVCARPTACRSGPPGKTRPCRLCVSDCDCTTRGHGKHGHGKGTAPQMGRARVLGTNWTLSALPHWFESSLLTSNKAVQVVGVHCA